MRISGQGGDDGGDNTLRGNGKMQTGECKVKEYGGMMLTILERRRKFSASHLLTRGINLFLTDSHISLTSHCLPIMATISALA